MVNEEGLVNEPEVEYHDSYMGTAPSELSFGGIAFASDMNGYQDTIAPAGPIARSTHPSHEIPHCPAALDTLPDVGSSSGLSQRHAYPSDQWHGGILEKSTRFVTLCSHSTC